MCRFDAGAALVARGHSGARRASIKKKKGADTDGDLAD